MDFYAFQDLCPILGPDAEPSGLQFDVETIEEMVINGGAQHEIEGRCPFNLSKPYRDGKRQIRSARFPEGVR